ncbi:hypothetical protein EDB80DRAFT_533732, partial [Ilyonectria destructans]
PYPDWRSEDNVPISKEEIEEIFLHLTTKFWFQQDSMTDMYDHFLTLLDSRASRMPLALAFISLHANYIGEDNANYRKWYFAVGLELENDGLMGSSKSGVKGKQDDSFEAAEERWKSKIRNMPMHYCIRQLALFLLC